MEAHGPAGIGDASWHATVTAATGTFTVHGADRRVPGALSPGRGGRGGQDARYASTSLNCPAGQPVFALTLRRRYRRFVPLGRDTVAVLPAAGSKR
ncbi:hypothetical protein BX260_6508 [Streptomyces sp. 5112.2]|nr:hypothetical protein BX260_6508 [Streptomyces sp. 5112.2]